MITGKPMLFSPRQAIFLAVMILAAAAVSLAGCAVPTATTTQASTETTVLASAIRLITPADAKAMIETNSGVLLLDVRTAEEYAAGHIAGSQLLPYDEITARKEELPGEMSTPIIVYCRSGRRSAIAAETLAGLGYTEIYDLGGIQDWPYEVVTD